jgi:histidine phosphotransfer protein HptB
MVRTTVEDPVFDMRGTLSRMGNDRQLFQEMVDLLREDAPKLLDRLQKAVADRDCEQARRAAHTLKGQAATFGASRAVEAAAGLEAAARHGRVAELAARVEQLQLALAHLLSELCEKRRWESDGARGAAGRNQSPK